MSLETEWADAAPGQSHRQYQEQLATEWDSAKKAHEADVAQGGSIRAMPGARNPRYGALLGGTLLPLAGAAGTGGLSVPASGALATIGAMGGEGIQQSVERAMGTPGSNLSPSQAELRMLGEGAFSAGSGGAGRLALGAGAKLAAPFGNMVTPEAQVASRVLGGKVQPPLTPAQATTSRFADVMENIGKKGLFSGGRYKTYTDKQNEAIDALTNDFVNGLGPKGSAPEVGQMVEDAIKGNFKGAKAPAQAMYQALGPLADKHGPVIDLGSAKAFAAPLQSQLDRLSLSTEGRALQGQSVLEMISGVPAKLNYSDAQKLRSTLIATRDKLALENKKSPAIGVADQLLHRVDQAIDKGLGNISPDFKAFWRTANEVYSGANKQFNNSLIKSALRKGMEEAGTSGPESIVKTILQPGQPTRLNAVKQAVGVNSQEWGYVQRSAGEDLLARSTSKDGVIQGNALHQAMFGRTGYGEPMMQTLFTPQQINQWKELATTMQVLQAKQSEGAGGMMVQLLQGSAAAGVVGAYAHGDVTQNEAIVGDGVILLGPAAIAQLMTRQSTASWLLRAMHLPKGSPAFAELSGRLMGALGKTHLEQPATPKYTPTQPTQAGSRVFENVR